MPSKPLTDAETKTGEALLHAMGNVVGTWQGVEHGVLDLFLGFYRPHRLDSAAVTFFAVRTFDARLTLVNSLIEHFCSDEFKEEWAKIFQNIKKKGKRRNAVAHGLCTLFVSGQDREYRIGGTPFDLQKYRRPERKQDSYSAKELLTICHSFNRLTMQIADFSRRMQIDLASRQKFVEPQGATTANEAKYPLQVQSAPTPLPPPKPSPP